MFSTNCTYEKKRVNSERYHTERSASQPSSCSSLCCPRNVTRKHERIKITQKYRILGATDLNGVHYSLSELLEKSIINRFTSDFTMPSTGEVIPLDEAIERGIVSAELVCESLESTNNVFSTIESVSRHVVRINDLRKSGSSSKLKVQ